MGKILLSQNEKHAMAILRMLHNSSDRLYSKINKHIADPYECIVLLESLIESNEEDARVIINNYSIPENLKDEIIGAIFNTHGIGNNSA